jgi:uncharacterized cupin superfamily protein
MVFASSTKTGGIDMCPESILITSMVQIPAAHRQEHEPYEYFKHLAMGGSGNGCVVAFYEIPPQKSNYPYHYHTNTTEVFYIISGHGTLKTPEGEKPIQAGDVVICPPYEKGAHKITNASVTEMLTFLDVDTASDTDIAFYPDSNKVGVLAHGHYHAFFKKADEAAYYEGE